MDSDLLLFRARPLWQNQFWSVERQEESRDSYQRLLPNSISAVFEILRSKRIGITSLTFRDHAMSSVTWPFPIGDPLEPSLYL